MEVELDVFHGDTAASRGITADRLAALAEFDCDAHPIPLVIGHPQSDSPAEGVVKKFRLEGSKLFATLSGMTDKLVSGIRDGSILNRSMAFFDEGHEANPTPGKLAPRHLGFLGASAPGIPGMTNLRRALSFSADDAATLVAEAEPAPAVIFAATPTAVHTITEAKEAPMADDNNDFAAREGALNDRETAIKAREDAAAARIKTSFDAVNSGALDGLMTEGKITPAEAVDLKVAFAALDPEGAELTFGAGDRATKATAAGALLKFMAGLPKRVPLGGQQSPAGEFQAQTITSPAQFNTLAEERAKAKGITFDAAAAEIEAEQAA